MAVVVGGDLMVVVINVASKLYGVDATIIIFVFVLYCIVLLLYSSHFLVFEQTVQWCFTND